MNEGDRSDAGSGSLFPRTFRTERLELERLCHETVDARSYYELCSHHNPHIEDVTRHLPWDPHETPRETVEYIDDLERKWTEGIRGEWVIRPTDDEDDNEKSRRAVADYVEALGGQYDGIVRNSTVRPDGRIVDHHRYTITREQYDPDDA